MVDGLVVQWVREGGNGGDLLGEFAMLCGRVRVQSPFPMHNGLV